VAEADKLKKLELAERHLERVLDASLEPDRDAVSRAAFTRSMASRTLRNS
jgi:hypothetical protein